MHDTVDPTRTLDSDLPHVAMIEMTFDNKDDAQKWVSDAEELGGKLNGELEDSEVNPA